MIKVLRDKKAALLKEATDLQAKDAAGTISEAELARLNAITDDELPKVNASIARTEKLMDEQRTMAPAAFEQEDRPAAGTAARVTKTEQFSTFGEQLQSVCAAGMNRGAGGAIDQRLKWENLGPSAGPSGANSNVPSEGGFLIQTGFSTAMLDAMHETGELLSRVNRLPLTVGNSTKLPMIDETSRADGSRWGGVQGYWAGEGDTVSSSKPKFREVDISLKKLFGLGYVTDEMIQDAPLLETIMTQAFTEELTFKTEDAIVNGDGAGKPLGILNSGALVQVAKESGQAADTILTKNALNMWNRLPARSRARAVWLINQDCEPQLDQLTIGTGTAVSMLVTQAGVNGNNTPYALLKSRPIIPIEYCAALGDVGDILLVDPMLYLLFDKGGIQAASSMHVRFIYDEMTLRFTFRVDGQPAWAKPVTAFKGSTTRSPYVALAAR